MANTQKVTILKPGDLLEESKDDDLITAKQWNTVMATIREAVNNHATNIVTSALRIVQGIINPVGAPTAPYWEPSTSALYWNDRLPIAEDNLYSTLIPQVQHQFTTETSITVQLFDTSGESIESGVYIQPNQDIIITSRRNIPVKYIIKGGA
jgi:hypothetical protein